MSIICKENAELRCDCYPTHCYGCNAFANPTNFDRIKYNILQMSIGSFIDFCGGNSCANVICNEIPMKYAHCRNGKGLNCGECIKEYLNRKPE